MFDVNLCTKKLFLTKITASYVGDQAAKQDSPPDPGAMAAAIFLKGLVKGMGK